MPTVTTESVCCKVKSLKVLEYFFLIVTKFNKNLVTKKKEEKINSMVDLSK